MANESSRLLELLLDWSAYMNEIHNRFHEWSEWTESLNEALIFTLTCSTADYWIYKLGIRDTLINFTFVISSGVYYIIYMMRPISNKPYHLTRNSVDKDEAGSAENVRVNA